MQGSPSFRILQHDHSVSQPVQEVSTPAPTPSRGAAIHESAGLTAHNGSLVAIQPVPVHQLTLRDHNVLVHQESEEESVSQIRHLTGENRRHAEQIAVLTQQILSLQQALKRKKIQIPVLHLPGFFPFSRNITSAGVASFLYESAVLHPFMDIAHTASIITVFTIQFIHSLRRLKQDTTAKEYVFHIKMVIASATIVLVKLAELFLLYELSPMQTFLMQGVIVPLIAYNMDIQLEGYIADYVCTCSEAMPHDKTD